MLGVLVVTHSDFAQGIHDAVEMIAGPQENFDVLCFHEGDDMMELSEKVKSVVAKYKESGDKFVICVDLFGATPFNASATALAEDLDANIITGVNLPILITLVTERDSMIDYDAFIQGVMDDTKDATKLVKMKEMFG